MDVRKKLAEVTQSDDQIEFKNFEKMAELSLVIASKIESSLFVEMGDDITKEYGKRFRDLLTALKNDENTELREGLLLGKILPEEFVRYERE